MHFTLKVSLLLTQKLIWHFWRENTAVLRVYKFYVAIYCTRIYLDKLDKLKKLEKLEKQEKLEKLAKLN